MIELNRAVAVGMAFGPAAGLQIVDLLTSEPSLKTYHLLQSIRGDLLSKLHRQAFCRSAPIADNRTGRALFPLKLFVSL